MNVRVIKNIPKILTMTKDQGMRKGFRSMWKLS